MARSAREFGVAAGGISQSAQATDGAHEAVSIRSSTATFPHEGQRGPRTDAGPARCALGSGPDAYVALSAISPLLQMLRFAPMAA